MAAQYKKLFVVWYINNTKMAEFVPSLKWIILRNIFVKILVAEYTCSEDVGVKCKHVMGGISFLTAYPAFMHPCTGMRKNSWSAIWSWFLADISCLFNYLNQNSCVFFPCNSHSCMWTGWLNVEFHIF